VLSKGGVLQTKEAMWLYNRLCEEQSTGALLHSTCSTIFLMPPIIRDKKVGPKTGPNHAQTCQNRTIYQSYFGSKLLILQWRRRESNPRPKTFRRRVYILVRFRFVSHPGKRNLQASQGTSPLSFASRCRASGLRLSCIK
jgi:hypothetical protein